MEERIIDDEYGRGIRMKKTKDGYVDVTDALADETVDEEEGGEELAFEFPELDEDDEDLVGLSPEEAAALRKRKQEEAEARQKEYADLVKYGNILLEEGSFKSAELKFEKALQLDQIATEASVGYWRAKTENFANPDVLMGEYVESGYENLEFDLGYEAVEIIKQEHKDAFQKRYDELTAEEEPLEETVREKQAERREILKPRLKKAWIAFGVSGVPFFVALILTAFFAFKIPTVSTGAFILPTVICGAVALIAFVVFGVFINKLINAGRIYRANESIGATDDGKRLLEIREYKELYAYFL